MMPSDYIATDGSKRFFDLDAVVSFLEGYSSKRKGWTSLVVYAPSLDVFIELRSSPPDIRGGSADEAEEISPTEIAAVYGVPETACMQMRKNPRGWKLIDLRSSAVAAKN
jgi:hypothetical protein